MDVDQRRVRVLPDPGRAGRQLRLRQQRADPHPAVHPPDQLPPRLRGGRATAVPSATVGDGGELLRAFGRKKIEHIPAPATSATQGTGRRFFVFPRLVDGLQDEGAEETFVADAIASYGKALLLAPDGRTRDDAVAKLLPEDTTVWEAEEFEDAPDGFEHAPQGVLALANRYDGIDLPGEAWVAVGSRSR
ncbi:hypothetical protein ACQP1W_31805 [Spirillospora sp. CA-255316]